MAKQNYMRLQCAHEKPLFSNGRPRLSCFECSPKPAAKERKKYEFKSKTECKCLFCGVGFVRSLPRNRFCTDKCRIDAGNLAAKNRAIESRSERVCRNCGVVFTPEYGVKNKLQCSSECQIAYHAKNRQRLILEKIASDPIEKLTRAIRTFICQSIIRGGYKKNSRTHEILGCDFVFFKSHIEKQFKPGMSWTNRSEWHIDHITPMASARSESEAVALNHYTNLRPLWANENLSKGAKATNLI